MSMNVIFKTFDFTRKSNPNEHLHPNFDIQTTYLHQITHIQVK